VQRKLCEECAHLSSDAVLEGLDMEAFSAAPEEFVGQLFDQAVAAGLITPEEAAILKEQGMLENISFKEITEEEMAALFQSSQDADADAEETSESGAGSDDEDTGMSRETPDFDLAELARITRDSERAGLRCPKCDMTWDRLKEDGRAGCAQCYATFEVELREVMQKMQRGPAHTGKQPRSAEKRRRRLQHLRQRRDSQLELLQRRLEESIAA
jgi:protein-arginine kinase activator protein McsA